MVEVDKHLPTMCEALGLIPSTTHVHTHIHTHTHTHTHTHQFEAVHGFVQIRLLGKSLQ
jgi:hypothetical protein